MEAVKAYTHTQDTPSNLWVVNHNLNTEAPIISVNVDNQGTVEKIIPKDIRIINASTVEIDFTDNWAGSVRVI